MPLLEWPGTVLRLITGKETKHADSSCHYNARSTRVMTLPPKNCSQTLFRSLKVERPHGQRFKTKREGKDETVAWLLWYNRARLHSTLAYVSPLQFEQDRLANQPRQANS